MHALVYGSVFVWVCNLCGTTRAWSVHLAGVQQAAHRIMMTVAVASVFGAMRGESKPKRRSQDGEEMKKLSMLEVQGAERKTTGRTNGPTLRGRHKKKSQTKERTHRLCVYTGLFLWGSVCVFQLWIVDYARKKNHEPVCQSQSAFSVFLQGGGLQTFK